MAVGTFEFYTRNFTAMNMADIIAGTPKIALVASTYTPDFSETSGHNVYSDISGDELANGYGYTTGGITLTTPVATAITNGFKFSSDYAEWTASGGPIPAWRRAVIYMSGTLWGLTSPLIGSFLGDSSPADIAATTDTNKLRLTPNASGWFDIS